MKMMNSSDSYGLVAVVLHWLVALLVLAQLGLGMMMEEAADEAAMLETLGLHAPVGLSILVLTVVAIVWRLANRGNPRPSPAPSVGEKIAAKATHGLLYLTLIGLGSTGIGIMNQADLGKYLDGSATGPLPDLHEVGAAETHEVFVMVLIALFVLHVAAAVFHQVVRRDGVLKRMAPWVPDRKQEDDDEVIGV